MSNQIRYISTNEKFHAEKPRPNTLLEFLFWKPPTVFPMACRGPTLNVITESTQIQVTRTSHVLIILHFNPTRSCSWVSQRPYIHLQA